MQEPEQEKCGTHHYAGCACHEQGWENKLKDAIEMACPRTPCSPSSDYPERIEETWRADAGWKRADEAEAKLEAAYNAIRFASERFDRVKWGWDGDCGSKDIIATLEDILPENTQD